MRLYSDGARLRWWYGWSPWVLRDRLRRLEGDCERDTAGEQLRRFIMATLDGHPSPWTYALRFRVEGDTLVIDATKDVHG